MSYPEKINLKTAGDARTITVTSCGLVPVGKYPEISFVGSDGGTTLDIRVPKVSADRQLARLELDYAGVVGKIVTISRGHNAADASKPFWNIEATVGKGSPDTSVPQLPIPPHDDAPHPAERGSGAVQVEASQSKAVLYRKTVAYMCDEVFPLLAKQGIELTHEGASAMIAQLWIEGNKR